MKIKYETTGHICHTPCPHMVKKISTIMVGSVSCQECPSFKKKTKRFVECDFPKGQKK